MLFCRYAPAHIEFSRNNSVKSFNNIWLNFVTLPATEVISTALSDTSYIADVVTTNFYNALGVVQVHIHIKKTLLRSNPKLYEKLH